ncbi:DUF4304 domain-containing protein [Thalassospira sp. NFXS8]|uniref:DUF4304 domain-containing protein n=1 Tax=Thalassospira sp. NFXS8 TaxID=2819093 RepID=UPI0032DF3867
MLADLIKNYVTPLLKQHGFKKKGLTWNKSNDGFVQVVNFQLSRFNSDVEKDFTINIGVFNSQVWKKCWGKEPPKVIKEEDCFPRMRVGRLLNKPTDHWWTYDANTNDSGIGKEIKGILGEKCLPFLNAMLDQNEVFRFYSVHTECLMLIEKVYLAIIKHDVGDVRYSEELLSEIAVASKDWAKRVDQVRSQLS